MADDAATAEKPVLKDKVDDNGRPMMHIRVSSPFTVFFDDDAYSITAENKTGPFDILPRHHNFITLLDQCEMIVRNASGDTRIQISGGIMHVKADQVIVFLNV
jgi:F0F1-type ATP synthase epsilon subunit